MLKAAIKLLARLLAGVMAWRFGEGIARVTEAESRVWAGGLYDQSTSHTLLWALFGPGRGAMLANGLLILAPVAVGIVVTALFDGASFGRSNLVYAYDAVSVGVLVWSGARLFARRSVIGLWKAQFRPAIQWAFLLAAVVGALAASLFVYLVHTDLAALDVSLSDAALGHSLLIASLIVLIGIVLPTRNP